MTRAERYDCSIVGIVALLRFYPKSYKTQTLLVLWEGKEVLEYYEAVATHKSKKQLKVVSYNIERGLRIDNILRKWRTHELYDSDIILLSEVDKGMARTKNRDIAREFADALGYSYAYAVEFHEHTKGKGKERSSHGRNEKGYHGNAIVSRYPLKNLEVVHLPAHINYMKGIERRTGNRNALVADVDLDNTHITVVSTHLESRSCPQERHEQMETIISAMHKRDYGQPIIIGGDMNTSGLNVHRIHREVLKKLWRVNNKNMKKLEKREPLFSMLISNGYDYRTCNRDEYTLKELRIYKAHLDWFFVKNIDPLNNFNPTIHREFEQRRRYSDHIPISIDITLE